MPVNKNAYMRYQFLDYCFCNKHKKYNIQDLINYVSEKLGYNISLRQIREDIMNLRSEPYNAPIKAIQNGDRSYYYRYTDPNYSIFKNELSFEEVSNLRSTIEMLNRYRGIPANAWLEEVISNLEYRFGIKANSENLISFEQNDMLKGLEHLSDLIDATINHQTLEIVYHAYGRDSKRITIYPYYIKQYNGRWFCFGMNDETQRIETYALDRIEEFFRSQKTFIPNVTTDFSTYFNDVLGVSVPYGDVPTENIVLRFTPKRFPYVLSKPIHATQTLLEEPFTISIKVKPNNELYQQIFSFIPDVEVLAPEWFRNSIKEKIQANLKYYEL